MRLSCLGAFAVQGMINMITLLQCSFNDPLHVAASDRWLVRTYIHAYILVDVGVCKCIFKYGTCCRCEHLGDSSG